MKRHRKPHSLATRRKIGIALTGSNNGSWVEKNPSYSSVHKWIDRNFIKNKKCDHCGGRRFIEWALKKGEKHDHNRDHYLCLCSSCHKKYDYTAERKEKMRVAMTGRKVTWGKKISKAQLGKVMSPASRKKMSVWHKANPGPRNYLGQFTS